eukprot:5041087-Pleurochrysis_carterae.AAC.1
MHAPHLVLQGLEAMRGGDDVRKEYSCKGKSTSKRHTIREVAEHALIRPSWQGCGDVTDVQERSWVCQSRAAGTKEGCLAPNHAQKGWGRCLESGASRIVVRSSSKVSSHVRRHGRRRGGCLEEGVSNQIIQTARAYPIYPRGEVRIIRIGDKEGEGTAEAGVGFVAQQKGIRHCEGRRQRAQENRSKQRSFATHANPPSTRSEFSVSFYHALSHVRLYLGCSK